MAWKKKYFRDSSAHYMVKLGRNSGNQNNIFFIILLVAVVGFLGLFYFSSPAEFEKFSSGLIPQDIQESFDDQVQSLGEITENPETQVLGETFFPGITKDDIPQLERRVHELINVQRKNNGLNELSYNDTLANIARLHSQDMAQNNFFDHDNLSGLDPTGRGSLQNFKCRKDYGSYYTEGIAENIFQNNRYDSVTYYNGIPSYDWSTLEEIANSTVDGWMTSPGHRENILTADYGEEGIGITISSNDEVLITENFC